MSAGRKNRWTVLDVARRAGVSTATVSRVLSGTAFVSSEIQDRVRAVVRELDFRPNHVAQGLRTGKRNLVALLVADIQQSVYAPLTRYLQAALEDIDQDVLLYNLGHSVGRLKGILERAMALQLRGVVISSTDAFDIGQVGPLIKTLQDNGVIVISIVQSLHLHNVPSIVYEEHGAVARSVRYLLERYDAPVAYLGRIKGSAVGPHRLSGYREALAQYGIPMQDDFVWDVSFRNVAGYEMLSRSLDSGTRVRAIQAGSDELALGAMAAIQDHNLRIPDDIAVVGIGDIEWSKHLRPTLTTMGSDAERMALTLQDIFRRLMAEKPVPPLSIVKRPLILRRSA